MASTASFSDGLYMALISAMPRKRFGRVVRRVVGWEGSSSFGSLSVRVFAQRFGIDVDEAELPLEAYPNVHAFFTRRLKPGVRPVDPEEGSIVSPVDGVLSQHGPIEDGILTQVKGRTYTLEGLMGGAAEAEPFQGGQFLTIYLSPRHYHRIHSPVSGEVTHFDHIPGHLWPVNGPSVRSVPELFAVNERIITYVRTAGGAEVAVIKVGAVGVGRISLAYHDRVSNDPDQGRLKAEVAPPYEVARGGELGVFELGSTVIVVLPPGLATLSRLSEGQELRMGERIGMMSEVKAAS